jgi:hypothetical protein
MKYLFLSVILLGFFCSCAHDPEPQPLYTSRFYTEKDAYVPNGWRCREDGFFARPNSFEVKPYQGLDESSDKYDERANLFTVNTLEKPALYFYSGFYEVEDDSIIDVVADAAGKGSFSLGVEFFDADRFFIGERHQGFNLLPASGDKPFKNYRYRMYFLANENGKARYVRLMFITDPFSSLTLRDISLDINAYEINKMDSTYIKFKEQEAKQNRKK